MLLDDLSAEAEPADGEPARYLDAQAERFAEPTRLSFQQVYVDADGHADPAAEAQRLLGRLRAGEDPAGLGDQTLLNTAYGDLSRDNIARQFGKDFAEAVAGLEAGSWSEPVGSP